MNQPLQPESNSLSVQNSGIGQKLENSHVQGGMQTTQGNKNVQVQGEGNVLTFNQTEILQISVEKITSRELITTSPYKGLKSFESRDKELFFGRDNFISTLVNELEQTNLILLLGASGSGKSSVVRAGLIPWLAKKYGTGFTNLTFNPDADLSATESKKGLFGSSKSGKSGKSHSTIEITHEILLTSWKELNHWIQENRQGIALRNRLYEDVKRWQTKKPEDELWTGSKLEQVLELRKNENFNRVLGGFNTEANQFMDQSVELRDRQLRRARMFAFTVAGLASVASVIALGALYQLEVSSLQEKAARAQNLLSSNSPMDGLILAIQATGESQGRLRRILPQIRTVLPNAIDIVRERNILRGHDGWVISVAVSRDGKYIATGGQDSTVRLWSIEGELLNILEGHEGEGSKGWVNSVAFSPDGKYIVSGGADTKVRLWSIEGELLKTFKLKDSVNSVSFSPSSDRIITGSSDGTVQLWLTEGTEDQLPRSLRGNEKSDCPDVKYAVRSVAFSSNGKYIVSGGRTYTDDSDDSNYCDDSMVWLWTLEGELLKTFTGHYWGVESVNLSPNYEPESGFIISGGLDRTLKLWSYDDGLLATKEHEAGVTSVSFSQDGEYIVSSSFDSSSRLWTIVDGSNLVELAARGFTLALQEERKPAAIEAYKKAEKLYQQQGKNEYFWSARKQIKELEELSASESP